MLKKGRRIYVLLREHLSLLYHAGEAGNSPWQVECLKLWGAVWQSFRFPGRQRFCITSQGYCRWLYGWFCPGGR